MIRMKIAFALRLVDDYSGKDIRKNSFLFSIGERIVHPVEKENGLYIFLEPQEAVTRVHLEGPDYHPCTVQVEKKHLSPEEPVAEVRMYRRPGRGGCEYLEGQLPKEDAPFPRKVCFLREKPTGLTFRDLRRMGEEYWFLFQGFTREDLTGKPCMLENRGEFFPFVIMEKRGINEYRVEPEEKPPEQLEKGGALVRIYRTGTDQNGAYAIPVGPGEGKEAGKVIPL